MSGILFPLPLAALTLSSFSSTPHLVKTRTPHGKADSSAASGHCCNLCCASPISPADTPASSSTTSRLPPTPDRTTLSTLIYTTPSYASATETNSKLGKARCNHAALHAHLGSEGPAGDPCHPRPGRLSVVQPAVRCVGPASLHGPFAFPASHFATFVPCSVHRPAFSVLPLPALAEDVLSVLPTGPPRDQQNPPHNPEQHDGSLMHDDLQPRHDPEKAPQAPHPRASAVRLRCSSSSQPANRTSAHRHDTLGMTPSP